LLTGAWAPCAGSRATGSATPTGRLDPPFKNLAFPLLRTPVGPGGALDCGLRIGKTRGPRCVPWGAHPGRGRPLDRGLSKRRATRSRDCTLKDFSGRAGRRRRGRYLRFTCEAWRCEVAVWGRSSVRLKAARFKAVQAWVGIGAALPTGRHGRTFQIQKYSLRANRAPRFRRCFRLTTPATEQRARGPPSALLRRNNQPSLSLLGRGRG